MSRVLRVALVVVLAACGGGDDDGGGSVDARPGVDSAGGGADASVTDGGGGGADASGLDGATASACVDVTPLATPGEATGTTLGRGGSTYEGSCAFGESGPEVAYSFTAPMSGTLSLSMTAADADLGVYLLTTCGDPLSEVDCEDAGLAGDTELLTAEVVSGTTYYVIVDGYTIDDASAFTLEARIVDFTALCSAATAVVGSTAGNTTGGSLEFQGSCTGTGSPSAIYSYTPGATGDTGDVTITLTSATDQGVYLRTACADDTTEIVCGDTQLGGTNEVIRVPATGGVPLTIIVDGFVAGAAGPHTLDVAYAVAACGNGVVEGLEACDAVALPTAACSATCTRMTPTTETSCNDLADEDGDDAVDCRDIDCACVAGAGALATACDAPSDCAAAGSDPFCFDYATYGWPSGHCTQYCDPTDASECGAGNTCLATPNIAPATGICFKACTDPAVDCPSAGYECLELTPGAPVCWPLEACADARDNNLDGHSDCEDPACVGQGACPAATEVEPNNASATANPYAAGYRGVIAEPGDIDWVAVTVPGPASTIVAKVTDGGTGGCVGLTIDPFVRIFAADGATQLAENEDMLLRDWCSRAGIGNLAAGTYYVQVESSPDWAPNDTFTYGLDVTVTP